MISHLSGLESLEVVEGGTSPTILTHDSQMGVGVMNACGLAAMLMLLKDCGLAMAALVSYWSRRIDPTQDGTTTTDLAEMARQLGGHVEIGVVVSYPFLQLVWYDDLPIQFQNPLYAGQHFKHWIVREKSQYWDVLQKLGQGGPFIVSEARLDSIDISLIADLCERPGRHRIARIQCQYSIECGSSAIKLLRLHRSEPLGQLALDLLLGGRAAHLGA